MTRLSKYPMTLVYFFMIIRENHDNFSNIITNINLLAKSRADHFPSTVLNNKADKTNTGEKA